MPPQVLISDGATSFVNNDFNALCDSLKITHKVTLADHPQAHGAIERNHREIRKAAMKVLQDISPLQ